MSDSTKERFYFIQNKFIWNYFYTIGDYNKGSSRNPEGKKSYLSGSKKIKEMSYDQFLRFIFPERECLIILSCLISKKSRIG